jgi:predicted Zn-dependent protease with MMP-like domain
LLNTGIKYKFGSVENVNKKQLILKRISLLPNYYTNLLGQVVVAVASFVADSVEASVDSGATKNRR